MAATAFPYARVSVPSPVEPDLLRGPCLPRLLFARLSGARPARTLDGVISPQDGKASIALPQWRRRDFLPLGLPPRKRGDPGSPIPREPRKSLRRHPPLCSGPSGCVVDRLQPSDRHRGRDGRGLEQPRRDEMATIGSFKKSGNEFQGEIVTLRVQAKGVRILPEP